MKKELLYFGLGISVCIIIIFFIAIFSNTTGKFIGNPEIPNNQPKSTKVCEPFRETIGFSCNAMNPCPIIGYQPTDCKRVLYQECLNNQCVTKALDVLCNFPSDCTSRYCITDSSNPRNNRCS